jgi:hypothetical protein
MLSSPSKKEGTKLLRPSRAKLYPVRDFSLDAIFNGAKSAQRKKGSARIAKFLQAIDNAAAQPWTAGPPVSISWFSPRVLLIDQSLLYDSTVLHTSLSSFAKFIPQSSNAGLYPTCEAIPIGA